jgi:hypothetical protein
MSEFEKMDVRLRAVRHALESSVDERNPLQNLIVACGQLFEVVEELRHKVQVLEQVAKR